MTKLSDTQAILLSAAAQRADGNLLPLPGSLRGGAAVKVVGALLARGLAREEVTDRTTRADSALNTVWRNEDDGRAVLLLITAARRLDGRSASSPRRSPYPFNEGTNSAGEPAAGAPDAAPTRRRSRPRQEAPGPAAEGGAHGARRAPRRARPATTPSRRS